MAAGKDPTQTLEQYQAKRQPTGTPEPFTSSRRTGGSLFVIHHHAARAVHFDLRLEIDGALWSWAVPKGPSTDPNDKRLAVQVESHPVDYAWFEGLIPAGNYGAGAMIVWDRGNWVPLIEPHEGMADGKLLFDLQGHKLHGRWTLVRTGKKNAPPGRQWLLIKETDAWVGRIPSPPPESVVSGLTVSQLKSGYDPQAALGRRLKAAGVPERAANAARIKPMLCTIGKPFDAPDWLFEVKYDGYRVLASKQAQTATLRSRNGRDISANFPELTEAVAALPYDRFLLDGELVVTGADGLPAFSLLQQRAGLRRAQDVERAAIAHSATFYAFDLLLLGPYDLRDEPLSRRKKWLKQVLPPAGSLRYVDHVEQRGQALFEQACQLGLEGLVAKVSGSRYEAGKRSAHWRKLPALRSADLVVLGFVPAGNDDFANLMVGLRDDTGWISLGRVGSGLDQGQRANLREQLDELRQERPAGDLPQVKSMRWTQPQLVVTVRYKNLTRSGQLRQPVLLGLAPDKVAAECGLPSAAELAEPVTVARQPDRARVIPTNTTKIFWPEAGYTKGDLLDYYRAIAPWMLPWLADRPIVMTRYPDGIEGKSFFQHEAPDYLPDWIATCSLKKSSQTKRYIIIDSADSLVYLANLGTIEFHVWSARCSSIAYPDYCILDLDPKGAPFADVILVARELHALFTAAAIPHVLKTSGGSGLHLLVPLDGTVDHEQSRQFAELVARMGVARRPDKATIQRSLEHRGGRVYIDFLQNGYGKTIAAPFGARPVPAASVSMPLRWHELKSGTLPGRFNLKSAPRRMRSLKLAPTAALFDEACDLASAIERLAQLSI